MVLKVFCRTMSADNRVCAERFIRPLAGERKNSLFFGSDKMAGVSAVYHTIIFTCRMQGVSVLDYFKRLFSEIVKGRRYYEYLLPLTIGLEQYSIFLTLIIGELPCGGFPWGTRQNWTIT